MLMYPYTLKQTFAIGFPGIIRPIIYSVMTFSPGVFFSFHEKKLKEQLVRSSVIRNLVLMYFEPKKHFVLLVPFRNIYKLKSSKINTCNHPRALSIVKDLHVCFDLVKLLSIILI